MKAAAPTEKWCESHGYRLHPDGWGLLKQIIPTPAGGQGKRRPSCVASSRSAASNALARFGARSEDCDATWEKTG